MSEAVLFVDDDVNVLQGYQRTLRRQFKIETVDSGTAALSLLDSGRNFSVIVSDMRMPGMDGLQLLRSVKSRTADIVRIMVTGNSDQQTAVAAINEGDVYRFLTKPCDPEVLVKTIQEAIAHYNLLTAERELLEGTLAGAVAALGEALSLVNPEAFGRIERLKTLLNGIGPQVGFGPAWKIDVMATLSLIGCVILPDGTLRKLSRGQMLSAEELRLYQQHPSVACNLIEKIPRLGDIAESIRYQLKNFDGSGIPKDDLQGEKIPLGARLLKLATDYIAAECTGLSADEAIEKLQLYGSCYDPRLLQVLEDYLKVVTSRKSNKVVKLPVSLLEAGMIVAKDIVTRDRHVLLLSAGLTLTETSRERLLGHVASDAIDSDIDVYLRPESGSS